MTLTPANDLTPVTILIVAQKDMDAPAKYKLCAAGIHRSMSFHRRSELDKSENRHFGKTLRREWVKAKYGFLTKHVYFVLFHQLGLI